MNGDMHAVQGGDPHAQEGGEMVRVPPSRASYLVRTEDADGTARQLFCDDEKEGIIAQDRLTGYLTSLILLNRYAIGPAIRSIRRWDDDDSLHEMHLSIVDITQEMDGFDDEEWVLEDPRDMNEDFRFTVRIDRRNQQ